MLSMGRSQTARLRRQQDDLYRWLAARRQAPARNVAPPQCQPPSRRVCAWLLSDEPSALDDATQRFLHHLFEHAPELLVAGELAGRFAALIRGGGGAALDQWIADAAGTELNALAKGIRREVDAVKAAITHPLRRSSGKCTDEPDKLAAGAVIFLGGTAVPVPADEPELAPQTEIRLSVVQWIPAKGDSSWISLSTIAPSTKLLLTHPHRPTPRRRRHPTTSCAPGITSSACRSS